MSKGADLLNQNFGFLQAIEKMSYTEDRYTVWRCRCANCGGEAFVNTKRLTRGTITSCGCVPKVPGTRAENLTGQVFGDLTALYRVENQDGRTRWMCRCVCGTELAVKTEYLKNGHKKSCGCYRKRHLINYVDITDRQFARLRALYPTERRDSKGSIYWHCQCECGKELEITSDTLLHGGVYSCGCLRRELQKNLYTHLRWTDDTCVELLERRKRRSDNTSGVRGVIRIPSGRYLTMIGFKKKYFYLGVYDDIAEAAKVRAYAEKVIHEGFVKAYYRWEKKASLDPVWAQQNPLVYDVKKVDDYYVIITNDPEYKTGDTEETNITAKERKAIKSQTKKVLNEKLRT